MKPPKLVYRQNMQNYQPNEQLLQKQALNYKKNNYVLRPRNNSPYRRKHGPKPQSPLTLVKIIHFNFLYGLVNLYFTMVVAEITEGLP